MRDDGRAPGAGSGADGRAPVGIRESVPEGQLAARELQAFAVEVAHMRFAPGEFAIPPLRGHLVNLHLGAPVRVVTRLDCVSWEGMQPPGHIEIFPASQPFKQHIGGLSEDLNVLLDAAFVRRVAVEAELGADPDVMEVVPAFAARDPEMEHLLRAFDAELAARGAGGQLYAEALAQELAVHLLRRHSSLGRTAATIERVPGRLPDVALRRVTDYIEDNLTADLSLAELAGVAGYSPYHFARLFRQSTGRSPHAYVVERRVERAVALLTSTALPVEAVAHAVGFANRGHLERHVKRLTGHSPAAHR